MFDSFAAAKVAKQRLEFLCSQTLDALERVGEATAAPPFTVEGVDEPVGFVAGVDQHTAGTVEHERIHIVSEDGLLPLGQGSQWEPVGPTVFFEGLLYRAEVGFATVDEQEVRPFFLSLRPTHHHFLHHSQVIKGLALHDVLPVFFFRRSPVAHHDACTDPLIALQLGHVKADDVVELAHAEGFGTLVSGTLLKRTAGLCSHPLELNLRVLPRKRGQVFQVATLGRSYLYRRASSFVQPRLQSVKNRNR